MRVSRRCCLRAYEAWPGSMAYERSLASYIANVHGVSDWRPSAIIRN